MAKMDFVKPGTKGKENKNNSLGLNHEKKPTIHESLSALSIRDLEKLARKDQVNGKAALDALRKKYKINEVRLAVRSSLTNLSKLNNEIGVLASQALEEFRLAESKKQRTTNFNSKSFTTIQDLVKENKKGKELPKANNSKSKGKRK